MDQKKAGVALTYFAQLIDIITGLAYTPIMLHLLGKSEYGLYQLVQSVVAYLSLLNLGFSSSYIKFYTPEKIKGDNDGIARLNGMFMIIFSFMSLICIICGIIMLTNIKTIFGSGLTESEYHTAKILFTLMVFNMAISFFNSLFNCFMISFEKFVFQRSMMLLQKISNPFICLPLLILGYGSIGIVVVSTCITFVSFVINTIFCIRKLKIRFMFRGLKFNLLKEMWNFTFFIFLNQIIDQVNWSVDKFLLGRMVGTTAVAIYGIGAQINSMYLGFSTSISNVFIPKINHIVVKNQGDNILTDLFIKVGRMQFIITMLILSGFIFFGQEFVGIWAGKGYETSYWVVILIIVPVTVPLIQNIGIEIQKAKDMHQARSIVYGCMAICNVLISILLIPKWGILGGAVGTAISLIFGNIIFMNWYYHNKLNIDIIKFWKNIMGFLPALLPSFFCGIMLRRFISFHKLYMLPLGIILYTFVYLASMYLWGMDDNERSIIKVPLKKIWKSRGD